MRDIWLNLEVGYNKHFIVEHCSRDVTDHGPYSKKVLRTYAYRESLLNLCWYSRNVLILLQAQKQATLSEFEKKHGVR